MKTYDLFDLQAHFATIARIEYLYKLRKQPRRWTSAWFAPSLSITEEADEQLNIFCKQLSAAWIGSIDLEFEKNKANAILLDACLLPMILFDKYCCIVGMANSYYASFNESFNSCILSDDNARTVLYKFDNTILSHYSEFMLPTGDVAFRYKQENSKSWKVVRGS